MVGRAMFSKSPFRRLLPVFLFAVPFLLLHCAPVKVKPTLFEDQHPFINRQVMTNNQPSDATRMVLRRLELQKLWRSDPFGTLNYLDALYKQKPSREIMGVMAELTFLTARQVDAAENSHRLYLLAAGRAYSYIFDENVAPGDYAFDPRYHQLVQLYNLSLGRCLALYQERNEDMRWGRCNITVRDKTLIVQTEVDEKTLDPNDFDQILPSEEMKVKGFSNIYQRHGIGAPMTMFRKNRYQSPEDKYHPPEGIIYPATAVMHFKEVFNDNGVQVCQGTLRFYDPRDHSHIRIGQREVPLSGDFTTPYAYLLKDAKLFGLGVKGLLNFEKAAYHMGIFMLEPYDPNKIPLVMVHGLMSSPLTWMELTNDINGDPHLRKNYQIWHYMYPTAAPFLYSGYLFRHRLEEVRRALDPEGQHKAMDGMVVVAHSMGGLITKTLVADSGKDLWNTAFKVKPDALAGAEEDLKLVRNLFMFQPRSYVDRVIFIATPHRGSKMSEGLLGRIGSSLVKLPTDFKNMITRLVTRNPEVMNDKLAARMDARGAPNSIDALSPEDPVIQSLADLEIPIPFHSIIGDRGKEGGTSSDGIVPYSSSHLDGATSELIVPAGHDVYEHPRAIAEVKRILRNHLGRAEHQSNHSHQPNFGKIRTSGSMPIH